MFPLHASLADLCSVTVLLNTNTTCADCNANSMLPIHSNVALSFALGVAFASKNLGVFLCESCGRIHHELLGR